MPKKGSSRAARAAQLTSIQEKFGVSDDEVRLALRTFYADQRAWAGIYPLPSVEVRIAGGRQIPLGAIANYLRNGALRSSTVSPAVRDSFAQHGMEITDSNVGSAQLSFNRENVWPHATWTPTNFIAAMDAHYGYDPSLAGQLPSRELVVNTAGGPFPLGAIMNNISKQGFLRQEDATQGVLNSLTYYGFQYDNSTFKTWQGDEVRRLHLVMSAAAGEGPSAAATAQQWPLTTAAASPLYQPASPSAVEGWTSAQGDAYLDRATTVADPFVPASNSTRYRPQWEPYTAPTLSAQYRPVSPPVDNRTFDDGSGHPEIPTTGFDLPASVGHSTPQYRPTWEPYVPPVSSTNTQRQPDMNPFYPSTTATAAWMRSPHNPAGTGHRHQSRPQVGATSHQNAFDEALPTTHRPRSERTDKGGKQRRGGGR